MQLTSLLASLLALPMLTRALPGSLHIDVDVHVKPDGDYAEPEALPLPIEATTPSHWHQPPPIYQQSPVSIEQRQSYNFDGLPVGDTKKSGTPFGPNGMLYLVDGRVVSLSDYGDIQGKAGGRVQGWATSESGRLMLLFSQEAQSKLGITELAFVVGFYSWGGKALVEGEVQFQYQIASGGSFTDRSYLSKNQLTRATFESTRGPFASVVVTFTPSASGGKVGLGVVTEILADR